MLTEDETGVNEFQSTLSDGDYTFLQDCRKARTVRFCKPAQSFHKFNTKSTVECLS